MDEIYLTCRVCSVVFKDQRSLIRHLKGNCGRDFGTYENYIINFYYNGAKPVCKCGCGVELTFESHRVPKFYNDYTRNHFPRKPHTDASKEKIANGYKRTMQANYGVDNAMEIPEFKRKIKETKLKRYNDENYNNTPKARETSLQRFGVPVAIQLPEVKEKAAQTNIQRYGAIAITCTDAGKAKVKSTKEKRYGNPYYCNIEKCKETKLGRYGYECEFKDLDFRRKYNGKTSKVENTLCTILAAEPKFICGGYEFDFRIGQYVIEVDGDWYHNDDMVNLKFPYQIINKANDYKKEQVLGDLTLIRIKASVANKLKTNITLESVIQNSYKPNYAFDLDTVFVYSDHLNHFKVKYPQEKIIKQLYKFGTVFFPEFDFNMPLYEKLLNLNCDFTVNALLNIQKSL